jgi:hypothetical protein
MVSFIARLKAPVPLMGVGPAPTNCQGPLPTLAIRLNSESPGARKAPLPELPVPFGPVWQGELPTAPRQVHAPEAVMDTVLPLSVMPVLKLLEVPGTVNVPLAGGVVFTVGGWFRWTTETLSIAAPQAVFGLSPVNVTVVLALPATKLMDCDVHPMLVLDLPVVSKLKVWLTPATDTFICLSPCVQKGVEDTVGLPARSNFNVKLPPTNVENDWLMLPGLKACKSTL